MRAAVAFIVGLACFATLTCDAAEPQENLAKESQNPLSSVISLPFENNTYFGLGPSDTIANALLVKPVYPLTLGKVNLINRFIVPLIYLEGQDISTLQRAGPDFGQAGELLPLIDNKFGLGNIQYQAFLSPAKPSKLIWGLGPMLALPTNTSNSLGSDKWAAGVAAIVLAMPGNWVVGALGQNLWSVAGDANAPDINKSVFQYFVNYNLVNGWYLTSTPLITANWEAADGNTWTVPVGGGGGRLIHVGKQPVDLRLQGFWYAERPRFGQEWSVQFAVKFLFPKKTTANEAANTSP